MKSNIDISLLSRVSPLIVEIDDVDVKPMDQPIFNSDFERWVAIRYITMGDGVEKFKKL